MSNHKLKLTLAFSLLVGSSLACESISAIRQDYTEVRSTADTVATQAQAIITQARGIATQFGESNAVGTARAIATEQAPAFIATGEAVVTQAAEDGYLQTAEALVTKGSSDILPTVEALATQFLSPAPPPDDIPITNSGEVVYFFTNKNTVSYYTSSNLPDVIDFYQATMPVQGWLDVTDSNLIRDQAAILKFFKPDRVASINLTANQLNGQTVVLITIISQ